MNCSDKNILYYGNPADLPRKYFLKCGNLDVVYENGSLRYISTGGTELIRSIYSAVRDRNWGTILPKISNEKIVKNSDGFSIYYEAHYENAEIDFLAEYRILGKCDKIEFSFNGKALKSFLKNRIGFCVLHPLSGVKGHDLKIIHPDNRVSEIKFPKLISPHSPATNIVSMEWENEKASCRLDFEGDVWEMEDHRNWTDSSYKTYCTPLSIPFPATIREGERVAQKISFSCNSGVISGKLNGELILASDGKKVILPEIGIALDTFSLSTPECDILKLAGLKHVRYDVKFSKADWPHLFSVAILNASKLNIPIELVLHFTENAAEEIKLLQRFVTGVKFKPKYVWFIEEKSRLTHNNLIKEVCPLLRHIFPDVQLGGGTDAYFAEFNRNRFDASQIDFVTYAVCPQVHAFDNDSLVENMAAQTDTVESGKALYPGKNVHVSPVTLKQRFNVVATGEDTPVPGNQLPTQVDERQMSLFAAGWTLGSLASLADAGAKAVTYYQAAGWRGIIQGDFENPKPQLFFGCRNDVYPVYHLLRFLHKVNTASARICISNYPLKFTGLVIENNKDRFLIIANHTSELLKIKPEGLTPYSFIELSEDNVGKALKDDAFLDKAEWESASKEFVEVKPYALFFAKIK